MLAIKLNSPLVHKSAAGITAEGDVLPMHSGRYWNLYFQYQFRASPPFDAASRSTSGSIAIFDVEEYECVQGALIKTLFAGRPPVLASRTPASVGGAYRYDFKDDHGQTISLVFTGTLDFGCVRYLAIGHFSPTN